MRITELLEGREFDDLEFVKKDGDKEGVNFDVVEDLVYFMNHDDDVYRRHLYPAVNNCVECVKSNRKTSPAIFAKAVEESYKQYIQKYTQNNHHQWALDDLENSVFLEKFIFPYQQKENRQN